MTSEETTQQTKENSSYIPPKEAPMTKWQDPILADKKSGNDWLGLAYIVIGLFVLIATFQLYFVIQELIRTWISSQFVPIVSAIYYIVVIVGGVWLLREYIRKH
ncbi:MAG: hypothetical protein WC379_03570 [Methanoregula sp.]|jgi:hypothetical protein